MDNLTAKVSCFARAYHHRANKVHVFDDPAAEALLGDEYTHIAQSMREGIPFFLPGFEGHPEDGLRLIVDRQLSPSVLARSACCEKALALEQRLGCRQYLIFASGYDTFSLRNQDASLRVFELDLPRVLEDKRKRAEYAGLTSCAVEVPCDLSGTEWPEMLVSRGYCVEKKSFGSFLGISYYLSKDAFKRLIRSTGKIMAKGSAICLDYPCENESREATVNRALARGAGEAMKAQYSYREMEVLLSTCGFNIYEHLDDNAMTERFFSDYNARTPEHPLAAPGGVGYLLAVKE